MNTQKEYTLQQQTYFIMGFLEAALWDSIDGIGGEEFDDTLTVHDFDYDSRDLIDRDCIEFMEDAGDLLDSGDLNQHGMDFFFVRNGHGVGFKDRDLDKEIANELTSLAKTYHELHLWSDEGLIFCE